MPDEQPLVTYLPKLAEDLLPLKKKALNNLARGMMRFSLKTPNYHHHHLDTSSSPLSSDSPRNPLPGPVPSHISRPSHINIIDHQSSVDHLSILDYLPRRYRLVIDQCDVDVSIDGYRVVTRIEIIVKIYSYRLREMTTITIRQPEDICRLANVVMAASSEMQAVALGFLLRYAKGRVGSQICCLPRELEIPRSKTTDEGDKLRDKFWRKENHRDIQLALDKTTFMASLKDPIHGKLLATCDLFYSFRSRDTYLHVSLTSPSSRFILLKLLLGREDIAGHIHEDILSVVFDRGLMAKLVQRFVDKIGFLRCGLYTKAVVKYQTSDIGSVLECFLNKFKHVMPSRHCLHREKSEREVVCQLIKRFQNLYAVITVRRYQHCEEYDVELYFPKTQKRLSFEIFSEELLRMDRHIVKKIYELPTSELLYLIESSAFSYQKVKASIHEVLVDMC